MTLTITLTADIEQAIERKAARLGMTASEYIGRMTERAAKPPRTTRPRKTKADADLPKTGAELAAAMERLNLSGNYGDPAMDSPEMARKLRRQAETRDVQPYART